ncbi:Lsr2 family protein [Streptomyces sp. ID05-04B]|uniref:Lsr2 family DNA-binding protein n=1 Tax=Streptomyces sp. ID05-04B TaxID=3028661 RepID=UPI0029C5196A|nr:histone-like nucleoid-structuring protein Lsr2 [Streptomyces sp. ID05-04B]MDX5569822.1 Lsr2 family protein [Streptomyces sp. ID05-04B]
MTTAEAREDVAELLRQGATYRQIIGELGVAGHVVSATRRAYGIPLPVGPGRRRSPEDRAANEKRTIELLLGGATYQQIRDEVGITAPTIVAIRRKAGLPAPSRGRGAPAPRTIADGLAANVEAHGDGHARWTGPMAGRMPQLHAEGDRFNARHVIFERHHGRPPVGYVISDCGDQACVAGAHLTDDAMRSASPEEEPVTVQALRDLLDEIDRQGGPQAARDNRLHLQTEEHQIPTAPVSVTYADAPVPTVRTAELVQADAGRERRPSESLPVGRLLKWAEEHPDADVQATAQRTHAGLVGLRNRYDADQELTAITTEAEQLEKRLAELRARREELAPAKPRKKQQLGYDSQTVRAWARDNDVDCPATGRVPKAVVDAWRAATASAIPTK